MSTKIPFITIVTRTSNRPRKLRHCISSIDAQTDQDIQHLILQDDVGHGLLHANTMLSLNRSKVLGEYVYILDDDDFLVNIDFVKNLRLIAKKHDPDVIMVKGKIAGEIFPKKSVWENKPIRKQIGSPCFVVKNHVYSEHIRNFSRERAGDFFFIDSIFKHTPKHKIYWHDSEVFHATVGSCRQEKTLDLDIRVPYIKGKNLGDAYNVAMDTVDDWVIFMDHDILMLGPHYFDACMKAIKQVGHKAGWITCMTNRIACRHQLDPPKLGSDDIMVHMQRAGALWQRHKDTLTLIPKKEAQRFPFSGFFIMTHRSAWEKVGGFKNGFLGVDNDYHKKLIKAGFDSYVMKGIYCYHIYHKKRLWTWG